MKRRNRENDRKKNREDDLRIHWSVLEADTPCMAVIEPGPLEARVHPSKLAVPDPVMKSIPIIG